MPGFEEMKDWKRSLELNTNIYLKTNDLKNFGFHDQLKRSGWLIPSNVAECMERATAPDQIKFLDYTCGSREENLNTGHLENEGRLHAASTGQHPSDETRQLSVMFIGLINSIRNHSK